MRYFAIILALLLAVPAAAQDEAEETTSSFFLDVGPGFFTSLSDSSTSDTTDVSRSGISTFIGLGWNMSEKVALSARVNMTQESERSIATSVWGWIQYSLAGAGQPGIYIAIGLGTEFEAGMKTAARGGYQVGIFGPDVMGFVEAEGRYVNTEEIDSAVLGNAGLRAFF